MLIAVMIGVILGVIAYVVASSVLGGIDTSEFSSAEAAIVNILPIVMGVLAIIAVFTALSRSGSWGGSETENDSKSAYSGRELLEKIEREEEVPYGQEAAFHTEEEEEEEEEEEVSEPAEVSGFPQAPLSKKGSQGKPPWAI